MTRLTQRLVMLVIVPVALLTISGCVPDAPEPRPTAPSSVEPLPGTPEPKDFERIASRVPLACDELVPASVLSDAMGIPASDITPLDQYYPRIYSAAELQAGELVCSWTGPERGWVGEGQNHHELASLFFYVSILPDAGAAFHEYNHATAQWRLEENEVPDLLGQDSWSSCYVHAPDVPDLKAELWCNAEFEIDGYWVDYGSSGLMASSAEVDGVADVAPSVTTGSAIRDALHAAGSPKPPFTVPEGSLLPWDSCAAMDEDGALREFVGSPSLPPPTEYVPELPDAFGTGATRVDFVTCYWNQVSEWAEGANIPEGQISELEISLLPGGEWAWAELKAEALATAVRASGAVADVAFSGSTDGVIDCFADRSCRADALVEHSLVSVSYTLLATDEVGLAQGLEFMPKLIALVKEHARN